MNGINNLLVKTDRFCDYVPLVSSITNLVDLFLKCVILPFINKAKIESHHYYKHINEKSFVRCLLLVIPVVGNIIVGIYDFSKKKCDSNKIDLPNNIPSALPKIELLPGDANKEIRLPIGKPFSIKLWHSPTTGHSSWEISQFPSFITQVDTFVNDQARPPGYCGGGNDYGFVFEPKKSGKGNIIMRHPCSFDENRTEVLTFTIIAG